MGHQHQDEQSGGRVFRIWVQGRLDERFSNGLKEVEQRDVPEGTLLTGDFIDQSQLHSVLDHLRSLGIDVLRFDVDPPRRSESTDGPDASDPINEE